MGLKESIEEKFLTGVYIRVVDDNDITLSPTFRINSRVGIETIKKDIGSDYVLSVGISYTDKIERDRLEALTSMLLGAGVWVDTDSDDGLISGKLTVESPSIKTTHITVSGVKITQHTLTTTLVDLEENTAEFEVKMTFVDKEYLHGLSVFHDKVITPSNLKKLSKLISTNSFGELPMIASFDGKFVRTNIKPYGYGDMLNVSDNNVLIVHGYDGRIGVDISSSHTSIEITNSGYIMDIELKDKTHLYVYM